MLVSEFKVSNSARLIVINVHLAAFDDGNTRLEQLDSVLEFATREFEKGNYVVVGGDCNLRLNETNFEHTTDDSHLFWLADFPHEKLMDGWQIAADTKVPTVRTLHKPYVKGENYVCVIDGFILSPNIEIVDVRNIDLGFENSDHQPVQLEVKLMQ